MVVDVAHVDPHDSAALRNALSTTRRPPLCHDHDARGTPATEGDCISLDRPRGPAIVLADGGVTSSGPALRSHFPWVDNLGHHEHPCCGLTRIDVASWLQMQCVLVTEIGANPAGLVQALWALARHRGLCVRAAYVLTSPRGERYFEREILAPGAAYDQLHAVLGDQLVPRERLHLRVAPADDEIDPDDSAAWNEARWQNARCASSDAGDSPVVWALAGGRRRVASVVAAVFCQLRARPQDLLLDVRVGDRRAEESRAGFYFPEQSQQKLRVKDPALHARDVNVYLVEVHVPRLRALSGDRDLPTWAATLATGQSAAGVSPTLRVTLDLVRATLHLNTTRVGFTDAEFVWFAALVLARKNTPRGRLWSRDLTGATTVLEAMRRTGKFDAAPPAPTWELLLNGGHKKQNPKDPSEELLNTKFEGALRKLRSTAIKRYESDLAGMGLPRSIVRDSRVKQVKKTHRGKVSSYSYFPIEPEHIVVVEAPPTAA